MEYELYQKANKIVNEVAEMSRIKASIKQEIAANDLEERAKDNFYQFAHLEGLRHTINLIDEHIKELDKQFESL